MDNRIWAFGGGKGGTGKSFVASNVGIHLASLGREVFLIDVDLGAPNLHTLLGIPGGHPDLGDFLTNKAATLEEAAAETRFERLRIVKGTENFLFVANLNHYKKVRLLRHIKQLPAQDVILDIGTGSSYNSLDFFLTANPGILVITPEPTAIENTYLFLKTCIMRILKLYTDHYNMGDLYEKIQARIDENTRSLYHIFQEFIDRDPIFRAVFYRALRTFRPCLVLNKSRNEREALLGRAVADVVRKYLLIDILYLGAVPYDDRVDASLKSLTPYLVQHPDTATSRALRQIARDLAYSTDYAIRTPELGLSEEG
jgi:flagellar biosynthesis protein FlhG